MSTRDLAFDDRGNFPGGTGVGDFELSSRVGQTAQARSTSDFTGRTLMSTS